jgi:hypothetical protein
MRYFDPALAQAELVAASTTPNDVWIPYNVRLSGVPGNPNTTAEANDTISSNSINFASYLSYVLARGNSGNIVNTGNITNSGSLITSGAEILLGQLIGANMNVLTDQAIPITRIGTKRYQITRITVTNASTSLTAADGGIYTATSKGGTAVVAATQLYTALTSSTVALDLTLAVNNTYNVNNLYLSLTGTQGAAATADVRVYGYIL